MVVEPFDAMLVKSKCVWEAVDVSKKYKQTAENWKQIIKNWKHLPPLKRILELQT